MASLFHGCYSILLLLSLEQTVEVDIERNLQLAVCVTQDLASSHGRYSVHTLDDRTG